MTARTVTPQQDFCTVSSIITPIATLFDAGLFLLMAPRRAAGFYKNSTRLATAKEAFMRPIFHICHTRQAWPCGKSTTYPRSSPATHAIHASFSPEILLKGKFLWVCAVNWPCPPVAMKDQSDDDLRTDRAVFFVTVWIGFSRGRTASGASAVGSSWPWTISADSPVRWHSSWQPRRCLRFWSGTNSSRKVVPEGLKL